MPTIIGHHDVKDKEPLAVFREAIRVFRAAWCHQHSDVCRPTEPNACCRAHGRCGHGRFCRRHENRRGGRGHGVRRRAARNSRSPRRGLVPGSIAGGSNAGFPPWPCPSLRKASALGLAGSGQLRSGVGWRPLGGDRGHDHTQRGAFGALKAPLLTVTMYRQFNGFPSGVNPGEKRMEAAVMPPGL